MTKKDNYKLDIVPLDKEPGMVKFAYIKCPNCETKMWFNEIPVQPDKSFTISIMNKRGVEEDKAYFICNTCDTNIVLGLGVKPTMRDN